MSQPQSGGSDRFRLVPSHVLLEGGMEKQAMAIEADVFLVGQLEQRGADFLWRGWEKVLGKGLGEKVHQRHRQCPVGLASFPPACGLDCVHCGFAVAVSLLCVCMLHGAQEKQTRLLRQTNQKLIAGSVTL